MSGFFNKPQSGGSAALNTLAPNFGLTPIDATHTRYAQFSLPGNIVQSGTGLIVINTLCSFTATLATDMQSQVLFNGVPGISYSPIPDITGTAVQLASFDLNISTTLIWKVGNVYNFTTVGFGQRADGFKDGLMSNFDSLESTTITNTYDLVIQLNVGATLTAMTAQNSWSYYV